MGSHQQIATRLQTRLGRTFQSNGFVRKGRTYNRALPAKLVHVIELQLSRRPPGRCTINIGVYIPEVALALKGADASPEFVAEPECEIRARIGVLEPHGTDHWWTLSESSFEQAVEEIESSLVNNVLPFLSDLSDRHSIIERWNLGLLDCFTPPRRRVSLAAILHHSGNSETATALLREVSLSSNQNIGRLARIAARHLGVPVPPKPHAA